MNITVIKKVLLAFLLFTVHWSLFTGVAAAGPSATQQDIEQRLDALEEHVKEAEDDAKGIQAEIDLYNETFGGFDKHLLHREVGPPTFISKGFRIGIYGTFVLQGAHNATFGDKQDPTGGSFTADLTAGKIFSDIKGKAFFHLEAGAGNGVQNRMDLYSNVDHDAINDRYLQVTELWYQQGAGDIFIATFGKLDPTVYFDFNNIANDETTEFIGWMFRNNPTIEFPDNNVGLRLGLAPIELLQLDYAVLIANPNLSDLSGNFFNIGQFIMKPLWGGLEGNYRFIAWNTTVAHTKWNSPTSTHNNDYGFAFNFDQQIIKELTLFGRYGWQNPKVYNPNITSAGGTNYTVGQSWSAGLQLSGSLWRRENDVFAVGVGQNFPSSDYIGANPGFVNHAEGHMEIYYNFHLNKHLALSPDYQMIWNPYGRNANYANRIVSIFGLRVEVDI